MTKKKVLFSSLLILAVACVLCLGIGYQLLLAPQFHPEKKVHIYIDRDDTADSVTPSTTNCARPPRPAI